MDNKTIEKCKQMKNEIINEPDFDQIYFDLLENLGNLNPVIREDCLDIIWELIDANVLQDELLIKTGDTLVQNIQRGLGEKESDLVFWRTFSAMILGVLICNDEIRRREADAAPFLDRKTYNRWYAAAIQYAKKEVDFRGKVPGKGWAHSIAHSGDLLRDCGFHSFSTSEHHKEILETLSLKLTHNREVPFVNNDDNRLTRIVIVLLFRQQLTPEDYRDWLDNLLQKFNGETWLDIYDDREKSIVWFNTTTFLRALYFVLLIGMKDLKEKKYFAGTTPLQKELIEMILTMLKTMDKGLNYTINNK